MPPLPPPAKTAGILLCCLLLSLFLVGGASLPFFYESKTMLYKFGMDKTVLRMGKVAGICAVILFSAQLIIAGRFTVLDRIFSLNTLFKLHRINGLIIIALAIIHFLLILVPEGIDNLPIGKKFIPEMIGMLIVLVIVPLALFALQRTSFSLPYHIWLRSHRWTGFALVPILFFHVRLVSDPFGSGLPLVALSMLTLILLTLAIRRLKHHLFPAWNWQVETIISHSPAIHSLTFSRKDRQHLRFAPGQFVFLRLDAQRISREEHPFSISSSPAENTSPTVTIKSSGDWTRRIRDIPVGTRASLSVPYGQFCHINDIKAKGLLLIAGGIGITPLVSMVRHMADTGESRPVHLIWSYRLQQDLIFEEELSRLRKSIPLFTFTLHCTDTTRGGRRLSSQELAVETRDLPIGSSAYICGPGAMVRSVRSALLRLGFSRRNIHHEYFAL